MDSDEHSGHSLHHDAHGSMEHHHQPEPAGMSGHAAHGVQVDHTGHAAHDAQVDRTGHDAHGAQIDHTGHEALFRRRFWISLALSLPVLLYSPMIQEWLHFSMPQFPGSQWIEPLFSVAVFIYGGSPFLNLAIPELRARRPGMMTLVSMAICVAFVYSLAGLFLPVGNSFFWELVTLIDVMLLGHWLEMRSVRQASGALSELARLMPDTAERIKPDGGVEIVPIADIHLGDMVLVRPGSSLPVDGEVVVGDSEVNEAMITGESIPVKKIPGSHVIAGSINGDGSLRVQVTATGDQTVLAGIMRLVEQAQLSKSDTQILADKAAGWLFYIALGVALITGLVWSVATGFNVQVIERIATVLVIACPHALGLAIPLVVAITTSLGAKNGILVRDRLALEHARNIDTVIFDKTGTLTQGEFGVVAISTERDWTENAALALAAAIEGDSEHTIARGFRHSAAQRSLILPAISDFEALKGRGVKAKYQGGDVYLGGPRLIELLSINLTQAMVDFQRMTSQRGHSLVYLIVNGEAVVGFALADVIRPESKLAVQKLHEMDISVTMLTGDAEGVARSVAEELRIDQYFAELLPEHKDHIVTELQQQGKRVAMVGDGVNDAPALVRADVGIAIGGGTDIAIESAGIILVMSNPLDVVRVFTLSRLSYRKMVQNLIWATGYNVVALPLAAGILAPVGILLSPALGALFMSLSTVIVALNAQLLRRTNLAVE